jgi:hypothetical protein
MEHLSYFEQIACLARRKIYGVHEVLIDLEDPHLAGFLRRVEVEDRKYYDQVLDLLRSKYLASRAADLRLVNRRSILGKVSLVFNQQGVHREFFATGVNISHRGLCFELAEKVEVGMFFEARVDLLDQPEPMTCSGTIAWIRETLPGFFTVGMQFGPKK